MLSYLARAMVERPARPTDDPRLRAVVLVCMELGGFALHNQLGRHLGTDPFGTEGMSRRGRAMGEVLTGGLLDGEKS